MTDKLSRSGITTSPTRMAASDGKTLDLVNTPLLAQLFSLKNWKYGGAVGNPYQDHAYRSNVLGCAHSHFRAWEFVAKSSEIYERSSSINGGDLLYGEDSQIFLILEDDVDFNETFFSPNSSVWDNLLAELRHNSQWDICFLGTLDERDIYGDETVFTVEDESAGASVKVQKMSTEGRVHGAGAFAILVRPRGARILRELALKNSIHQAVDWFIFDAIASGALTAYKCLPMIATSPEGDERDSDNNEEYQHSRLLMMKGDKGGGALGSNSDLKVEVGTRAWSKCCLPEKRRRRRRKKEINIIAPRLLFCSCSLVTRRSPR